MTIEIEKKIKKHDFIITGKIEYRLTFQNLCEDDNLRIIANNHPLLNSIFSTKLKRKF